jgi:hypothetical protein
MHADVPIRDDADDAGDAVAAADGQAAAIVIPHELRGLSERVFWPATLDGPCHNLIYSHSESPAFLVDNQCP